MEEDIPDDLFGCAVFGLASNNMDEFIFDC
jgi:hypothetical protein